MRLPDPAAIGTTTEISTEIYLCNVVTGMGKRGDADASDPAVAPGMSRALLWVGHAPFAETAAILPGTVRGLNNVSVLLNRAWTPH
jgi:hypothetical protein